MTPTYTQFSSYSLLTLPTPRAETVSLHLSSNLFASTRVGERAANVIYPDLLLSGAGTYDRAQFLHAINRLGGDLYITAPDGMLHLTLRIGSQHYAAGLKLITELLRAPRFASAERERAIAQALHELQEAADDSKRIAGAELNRRCLAKQSRHYRPTLTQLKRALPTVTADSIAQLHDRLHHRHWYVSVAGPDTAIEQTATALHHLRHTATIETTVAGTNAPRAYQPTLVLHDLPSRQNIDFSIGLPLPLTLDDPAAPAFQFGSLVLGKPGGFAGRLMQTVREQHGFTYGIYAQPEYSTRTDTGLWRLRTFFHPTQAVSALTATYAEIRKIHERGITAAEHERFQTIIQTNDALLQDSPHHELRDLHQYHTVGYTPEDRAAQKAALCAISRRAVNDALKTYLDPRQLTVSGAGPTKAVRSALEDWFAGMA